MQSRENRDQKNLEPSARLLKELEENMAAWQKDIRPLLAKLRPLSPEQRKPFWEDLFQKGDGPVLSLLANVVNRDEGLALEICASLGHWLSPQAAALLQRIAGEHHSKTIVKAARKAIFRLKSQGMALGEATERGSPVYRPPQPTQGEGYLGHVDFSGNRMVIFTKPQIGKGVMGFTCLTNDTQGILEFSGTETSRKSFHDYLAELTRKYDEDVVPANFQYCYHLVAKAHEAGLKKGRGSSPEFLKWQSFLGSFPPPQEPLIYQYLKEEEIRERADLPGQAPSLFATHPFANWIVPAEQTRKYALLLEEAGKSKLVLSPYQKENRLTEIYNQAVRELFDPPQRLLLRRRMEENAYQLWHNGQAQEARICLASALRLMEEGGILASPSFLLELVKRSLGYWAEEEKEKKKEEMDLIIRP